MKRKIIFALVLILVLIQFFHPKKNLQTTINENDITKTVVIPSEVVHILQTSCYDCHSNTTKYPWYNTLQPIAWWLNNHIEEGKQALNFSEFGSYPAKKANHKLKEIKKEIEEDEMPLGSYTLIHRDAILSAAQKKLVIDWIENTVIVDKSN